jgi:hypothetical protein
VRGWKPRIDKGELERGRRKLIAYRTGRTEDGGEHEVRSLRQLAREVGMSPTGLTEFLDGTEPYWKTIDKVVRWYRALVARTTPKLPPVSERDFVAATTTIALDVAGDLTGADGTPSYPLQNYL